MLEEKVQAAITLIGSNAEYPPCRWVERKDWAQALFIAVKEAGPFKVQMLQPKFEKLQLCILQPTERSKVPYGMLHCLELSFRLACGPPLKLWLPICQHSQNSRCQLPEEFRKTNNPRRLHRLVTD